MAKDKDKKTDQDFGSFFSSMMEEEYKSWQKEVKAFNHPRYNYSTGFLEFDYMINPENPGIIGGNIIQSAGENHSGKTGFLLNMMRDHVSKGHKAVYLDPENGLTDNYSKLFGLTRRGTANFEYVKAGLGPERYQRIIISMLNELQGKEDPVIIGVDSIPFLYPEQDPDKDLKVGGNNQTFNRFINMVTSRVGNTNALVVLLNTVYADILNKYNEYKIPGGMTLPCRCQLICIHKKRVNKQDAPKDMHWKTKDENGEEIAYRQRLAIEIIKNKFHHCSLGANKFEYYMNTNAKYLPSGPDNVHSMLQILKEDGELKFAGSHGYRLNDELKTWEEWEKACYKNDKYYNLVTNKAIKILENKFKSV